MADNLLTTQQAAELVGYHVDYIRKLINAGKVKAQRFGRDWIVDRLSLLAYVQKSEKLGAKRGPKSRA